MEAKVVDFLDAADEEPASKAVRKDLRRVQNKLWRNTAKTTTEDVNPRHSLYYQAQLADLKDEWEAFRHCLGQPLPVAFRISRRCQPLVAEGLLQIISQKFSAKKRKYDAMHSKEVEKEMISKVSFMPEAWQLLIDSQTLSREAKHKALYGFLSREVSLGNIVRQELVSMIPAELLNVESHHYVFDMCASPGSKTDQLLSMLLTNKGSETGPATGMVVANDADPKRIQTLVKRFEHSGSPHLMFTCSRAEQLVSSKTGSPTEFFDRILCDVPCSGDGTFRKCSNLWRLFRPRMALELHEIQLQIASAGIELLKPGGRLVYSTCSLNPIEDEAVVAGLMTKYKGYIRMVNTRTAATKEDGSQEVAQLPNLVARQGIKQWHCDRDIFTIGEISAEERKKSIAKLPAITKTMRPPADGTIPLEFCLRIMPHDQDTGGFFVAVFEKFRSTGDLKGSKSTRFDRNSEELSVKAMKELGYNPKRLEIGKAENVSTMKTWNALHFNYDNFTDEDTIDKLGLRLNENYSAIRCSKVDGFDSSHDGFSVISKSVEKVVTEWVSGREIAIAQVGLHYQNLARNNPLQHAGLPMELIEPSRIIKVPLQDFYKIVQKLAYTTASIDTADGMAQHPRDSRNFSCRAINLPTKEDSYRALQLSIDCIATVGSAQGNINGSGIVSGLSQLCCSSLYDSLAPVEKYDVYYLECDVNLDSSTTAGNGKPDSSKRRLSKAEKKMQKRGTTDENADKLKDNGRRDVR